MDCHFNSGLVNALNLLQPIKDKYSGVTYADLFQLASATAVEVFISLNMELVSSFTYSQNCIFIFVILGSWGSQDSHEIWKG